MDNMNNKPCFFWLSLLIFCFFLHSHTSLAALTTISANQSLSGDQTLVSKDGSFELGFFHPGNSSRYYIAMWYKKVSRRTYVWVANRDDPVSDKNSAMLTISHGNLVLLENGNLVWSTNLSSPSPNSGSVEAVLLDNGNLILRDKPNASESESLWQSFDHPTDTWLPGGRIKRDNKTKKPQYLTSWKNYEDPATGLFSLQLDPNGTTSFLILWNKTEQYWASDTLNAYISNSAPEVRLNYIYNLSFVSNENESYFTYTLYNNSQLSRFVMDVTGQIKQLTWLEDSQEWNLYWSQPSRQCEVYAVCGAFGSCSESSMPYCNCVTGYEPKSKSDWDLGDYSDGCVKSTKFQCESSNSSNGTNDRFLTMPNMAFPEHAAELLGADSVGECELTCFSNCSCKAYAFYSTDTVCSLWYGDFLNLRQLNKDDSSGQTLFLKLAASEFHDDDPKSSNGISIGVIAGAVGGGVVVILLALVVIVVLRRKKRPGAASNIFSKHYKKNLRKEVVDLPTFDFSVLAYATKNFSINNKLGEGGFGPVYKGMLIDGQEIAVKRLSKRSTQGLEEFKNEVALIAKLQHRYLIKLLGCCIQGEETMLVYEYMPNKSLDYFVFDEAKKMSLDWVKRFNIISSIARGLLYLHQDSRLMIIHRDLKTSNILLDLNLEPKISDFGLARIILGDQIEANTNRVAGTYGYMSPEYAVHGHFSMKSDVFSYGVIVLEIVSGKKNRGFSDPKHYNNLLGYAWRLWTEERALELLDEVLREQYTPFEVIRSIQVGLLCVQQRPEDRPDMSSVVLMLNGEKLLPKPKVPGFYTEKDLSTESDSSSLANHKLCSANEMSITEFDAR